MTFIGPKPPIVEEPDYLTPFRAEDDRILDARGARVATGDTPGYTDDGEMAQAIADALNEKFGLKPAATPKQLTVTAQVYPCHADRWLVVDGKAYFQDYSGEVHPSIWTPEQLADGSVGEDVAEGMFHGDIDPAILEGVPGKS